MKVLIVEDQPDEAAYLLQILQQYGYTDVTVTASLQAAHDSLITFTPDICIIDIYLNGKPDGIVFATQINKRLPFVFLTSHDDTTTFQLARMAIPCSYLLKPYNPLELKYAIELAVEKATPVQPPLNNNILFVKNGNILSQVAMDTIRYIEVEGKYSRIICHQGKFLVQLPLKELIRHLPPLLFPRIHRNTIVNIREVVRINIYEQELFLKDGQTLAISRGYIDDLLVAYKVLK
ncbi:two component transcriptional regulator, LytTR family [Chitinophaga sp. CF118]|uniref:LytR/AlgR family response regulator transcription factor n=1 Tax=Chitinophaga sp. CF118 TaxID=1884367 RepID=UPI0008EA8541|nr:response regulator transcription factor [Chitinophaga sp. CF118]SFD78182.1 two component transcriptional regulator, LytTR family [Chitinophaga sp. CF118]